MTRFRMLAMSLVFACLACGAALPAVASGINCGGIPSSSCLYYGGDPNLVSNWGNGLNLATSYGNEQVYDNILVTSGGWTITGLLSGDYISSLADFTGSAYWEIRVGVSAGNGGTLIAAGYGPATMTPDASFNFFGLGFYYVEVGGMSVSLGPGQYWMTVDPNGTGNSTAYSGDAETCGAGCGGVNTGNHTPNDAFWTTSSAYFQPISGVWGFSPGVEGHPTTPEPETLALFGAGLVSMAGALRRRLGR
jgi:hypothetical protein